MKIPWLIVAILCFGLSVSAQQESKKSGYSKLKAESSRSNLNALIEEADAIKNTSPQKALELLKEALALSILRQDAVSESKTHNLIGDINMTINEWSLAYENYSTAYRRLSNKIHEGTPEKVHALTGQARASLKLENYEEAATLLNQLISSSADRQSVAHALTDLSEVYYEKGDFVTALKTLDRIPVSVYENDASLNARVENQKARIYAKTNQVEESYKRLRSTQNLMRSQAQMAPAAEEDVRRTKEEIAGELDRQQRYEEKIELLNTTIDYNSSNRNYGEVAADKVELANTLSIKGEQNAALRQLKEAAFLADSIDDPARKASAYLTLAEWYENKGQSSEALKSYQRYSAAVRQQEQRLVQRVTEKADLLRTQRDIEELSSFIQISKREEELAQLQLARQRMLIYGLLGVIAVIAVMSWMVYRKAAASKKANQLLALKSLRSQMNPHFIFNALNSVNQFISQNDERAANKFLTEFSRLMRLVMEHSQEDFISLYKEEEIITLYLGLEHYRFRDKFDYTLEIDDSINKEAIEIPPMLIQPYIENAIWHGLRYRETKGSLSVRMTNGNGVVEITIVDDGIGRKRSFELKTDNQRQHHSTGLTNIQQRIEILNMVYKSNYQVNIVDVPGDGGTKVTLLIPVSN